MNILHITSSYYPVLGGQEKVVYEISKEMVKKGHNVTILTTDLYCEEKNLPKEEIIEGIKIKRFKNDFFLRGFGYSSSAIKWLKENWKFYDVIHSHGYNRFLSEYSIFYLKNKKPTIFTPHGFIHTKKNYLFKKIHDWTIGKWINNATFCTALTKMDFKDYKKLGVKEEKIIEIPNGVNIKKFSQFNKQEVKNLKKKYNLSKKIILYVGRLHISKGIQYVLEVIKDLNVQFVIAGKDYGYKKILKEKISTLNIANKVIFIDQMEEKQLINLYQSCDIDL